MRQHLVKKFVKITLFQSTHPRGMRPSKETILTIRALISIHASAWDATQAKDLYRFKTIISIHASAWDATFRKCTFLHPNRNFNPRIRVGCDRVFSRKSS